ncbi:MAG: amylosucrase [Chloroflexota bacterium]|jgi:amylosucrase
MPESVFDLQLAIDRLLSEELRELEPLEQAIFRTRTELFWADVIRPLRLLYGEREDFVDWCGRLLEIVACGYANRSTELRLLDLRRQSQPDWFQQPDRLGYVCYTDRLADDLRGVNEWIPYLNELGVNYLHLMPLLKPRPGPNDGGYAVADYREVNPALGTMNDLSDLAARLRLHDISLCIDLVCNHTAKEHFWASRAMAGDPVYEDYYLMFPDRTMPDAYERTLPEVFPDFKPGNFTYYESIDRWVWTTFNEYQWDLNYANPAVLAEMLDIILFLANQGVEVIRLDAVAFMWKRLGTDSQNEPEAHSILQVFRALSRIAAPGLILKAEAIVSPPKLIPYLGQGRATNKECELAYHNVLMVLLWSSLAEQRVTLMTRALQNMPAIPDNTAWVTYVRCHDDIGWAVTDEDAAEVGISGTAHRAFLSEFYSGRFPGTFAVGATFQHNPRTGDRRISGSCASLAGLELALQNQDARAVDLAIRRILLLYNLIFAYGGIPLLYMGDEIGLLNDTSYLDDPNLADDNRWMHRPRMDEDKAGERHDWWTVPGRIFRGITCMLSARKRTFAFHAKAPAYPVWTHNEAVFGLLRDSPRGRVLVLANFSDRPQTVPGYRFHEMIFSGRLADRITGRVFESVPGITLEGYEALWLTPEPEIDPAELPQPQATKEAINDK